MFGPNVADQLSSSIVALSVSMIINCTIIIDSGLVHQNVGRVTQTTFLEVMFRVRYTVHGRSSKPPAAPLEWDDSKQLHERWQCLVDYFCGRVARAL